MHLHACIHTSWHDSHWHTHWSQRSISILQLGNKSAHSLSSLQPLTLFLYAAHFSLLISVTRLLSWLPSSTPLFIYSSFYLYSVRLSFFLFIASTCICWGLSLASLYLRFLPIGASHHAPLLSLSLILANPQHTHTHISLNEVNFQSMKSYWPSTEVAHIVKSYWTGHICMPVWLSLWSSVYLSGCSMSAWLVHAC